jgi:predicted ATP-dependent protease
MVRGTILINTHSSLVGQINGLSVMVLGEQMFGFPSRITARVSIGKGSVLDIEREVELGGPIHSKGVLILHSYLNSRYAREIPLSISASLVFEQSYGGVEGDSASAAELVALLSAIAEVPIKQNMAITGSVNQNGEVQAIGGVNEKIEGFFDLCKARGLTGDQGVIIPYSNIKNLMLRKDVVEAVEKRKFGIYPAKSIDQCIKLLTDLSPGELGEKGRFPKGTFNNLVQNRLEVFFELMQKQFGIEKKINKI